MHLPRCQQHESRQRGHAYTRGGPPPSGALRDRPYHRDEESDERNVGVAVGHAVASELNDAGHRRKRPQEPEPTDEEIRLLSPPPYRQSRNQPEQKQAARYRSEIRTVQRVGIIRRHVAWNEGLAEIRRAGDGRAHEPELQRKLLERFYRAADALKIEGRGDTGRRQAEQRDLLGHVLPERTKVLHAVQWPVVQEQQHEREGNQHGFA